MSLHIADVPLFKCFVRKEFLYNLEDHHGEFDECTVFGVSCIQGRAPLFNILLPNGAIYYRVPLHAFTTSKDIESRSCTETYFWDCFGYTFTVHRYSFLREMDVTVLVKNAAPAPGTYMFTIDWFDPGPLTPHHAEIPDEHKCHHIIHLEEGNFVAYPNNRILWHEASFVVRDEKIDYKTNTHAWYGEEGFKSENSDQFMYKTQDEQNA